MRSDGRRTRLPVEESHLPEEITSFDCDVSARHINAGVAREDDVERIARRPNAHQLTVRRITLRGCDAADSAEVAAGQRGEQRNLREQRNRLAVELPW